MNDYEAETLAHAVSNSDDLCLPSTPKPRFVSVSEGVNLNAESIPASKPGDYEQIYTEEVQQHRSLFMPKR